MQKWKRDSWTQHLYGRILRPSLGQSFLEKWTSCLADIPASPSVTPDCASAPMTQDTCGPTLQMELDLCAHESASLKMSKDTLASDSEKSLANWNKWVTKCRGEYSARLNAVRLTNENECLSWPTASTRDHKGGYNGGRIRDGKISMDTLDVAVQAHSTGGLLDPVNPNTHGNRPESWATPRAGCPGSRAPGTGGKVLEEQVKEPKAWATPQLQDGHNIVQDSTTHKTLPAQLTQQQINGKLNPRWVETLMGLPVGWTMPSCTQPVTIAPTNCVYSATELSQQPQN